MGKNRVTIRDIAKALNVTSSTVSRALHDHHSISDATKKLVQETAERLNYRPNHYAAALRSGRSNIIGIIVPTADRAFFGSVVRGIEDEVAKKGFGVIVSQAYDDVKKEKRALDNLIRSQVDGIISSVAKNSQNRAYYQKVKEEGVPFIFFDRVIEELNVSSVVIDDFKGGRIATRHLIDQGYRRIAHFLGDPNTTIYTERYRGYRQALLDANIAIEKAYIIDCPSSVEWGKKQTEKLFSLPEPPDAIFSSSDFAAVGALHYLKQIGVKVPEQVGIVGFANEPFSSFVDPSLSTVDQFSREMGKQAATVLLEIIENKNKKVRTRKIILDPKLIIRTSSSRKKNQNIFLAG